MRLICAIDAVNAASPSRRSIASYGLSTWLPQLMRRAGYPLGSSLALLMTLNLAAAVGSLFGGALADRVGSKRVVSALYLLAAASLCALPLMHDVVLTYVLVGLAGVGAIGNTMLLGAYIAGGRLPLPDLACPGVSRVATGTTPLKVAISQVCERRQVR